MKQPKHTLNSDKCGRSGMNFHHSTGSGSTTDHLTGRCLNLYRLPFRSVSQRLTFGAETKTGCLNQKLYRLPLGYDVGGTQHVLL